MWETPSVGAGHPKTQPAADLRSSYRLYSFCRAGQGALGAVRATGGSDQRNLIGRFLPQHLVGTCQCCGTDSVLTAFRPALIVVYCYPLCGHEPSLPHSWLGPHHPTRRTSKFHRPERRTIRPALDLAAYYHITCHRLKAFKRTRFSNTGIFTETVPAWLACSI